MLKVPPTSMSRLAHLFTHVTQYFVLRFWMLLTFVCISFNNSYNYRVYMFFTITVISVCVDCICNDQA